MNFGGHDSDLGRMFLSRIRLEIKRRAFKVPAERIGIDYASLGGDAGYIGAAGLARQEYRRLIGAAPSPAAPVGTFVFSRDSQ